MSSWVEEVLTDREAAVAGCGVGGNVACHDRRLLGDAGSSLAMSNFLFLTFGYIFTSLHRVNGRTPSRLHNALFYPLILIRHIHFFPSKI